MKKLTLSLGAFLVLGATLVAWTAAPAAVVRTDGCTVVDAFGTHFTDPGCRIQLVETANGFLVHAHGRLPDGAVLPNRSLDRDITELGFGMCFAPGDRGKTTTTPSGNFQVSCHPAR